MAAGVKTKIKREFESFNRTLGKNSLGAGDMVEGINKLHERLGDREFFLAYGQGMTGMRTLAEHLRTVLKKKPPLRPVITRGGTGVRLIPGRTELGRGLTAVTMKTKRGGKEMFIMRKRK